MKQKQKAMQRITGDDYVAYLRVSSRGQVNTDYNPEGVSIPAQRVKVEERGRELSSTKVAEFVDPGRSATSIDQRPEFQQMIDYLREHPNVRYVIVYMLSRFARNRLDDAIMVATLEKLGVRLISAVEKNIDDTPTGRMLHGMLAVINEYSSNQSAEDIKYKMGQKAKNGGTITRTPVGYLNTIEIVDGRRVRTVIVDPMRGPFIRLAFELYATGEYTVDEVAQELYDRGLRMPRNARYPEERGISTNRLYVVLRDDYYCGWITHDDEKYKGRHTPLIPQDLFDQVQMVADSRNSAREKRRIHHHELKGSLFCGSCRRGRGERRRMIVQHATNRHGNVYRYFFCNGRFDHICELPYIPIEQAEEAIEDVYATVRFASEFIATMRSDLATMIDEQQATTKLLQAQLTKQLRALDTKENNLIDLAADGSLPQGKIKARLQEITKQRDRLTTRLHDVDESLATGAEIIEACLQLLQDPQALYRRCNDQQRRQLNQALFEALYIDEDSNGNIRVSHKLREPFGILHTAQSQQQARTGPPEAPASLRAVLPAPKRQSAPPQPGTGAVLQLTGAALAGGPWKVPGSNELLMVGDTGFEPVTSSV
ncbi:Resolvase domain-containing protein [Actinobacteria bacterium OK074]|nr:Resolvase domain-containing protein [Actinobacteria bacterium OK074]